MPSSFPGTFTPVSTVLRGESLKKNFGDICQSFRVGLSCTSYAIKVESAEKLDAV